MELPFFSPSPRARRVRGKGQNNLVLATRFFAPELCQATARKLPPKKIKGGGAPTGAYALQPRHAPRRYRLSPLRARRAPRSCDVTAATRFGRARLSALRRGTRQGFYLLAQLRPAFPGIAGCKREDPPRRQCSELLTGQVVMPADRLPKPPECGLRARAQAPQPLHQSVRHRLTPLMSELDSPCRHLRNSVKRVVSPAPRLLILWGFFFLTRPPISWIRAPLGAFCESSFEIKHIAEAKSAEGDASCNVTPGFRCAQPRLRLLRPILLRGRSNPSRGGKASP